MFQAWTKEWTTDWQFRSIILTEMDCIAFLSGELSFLYEYSQKLYTAADNIVHLHIFLIAYETPTHAPDEDSGRQFREKPSEIDVFFADFYRIPLFY